MIEYKDSKLDLSPLAESKFHDYFIVNCINTGLIARAAVSST